MNGWMVTNGTKEGNKEKRGNFANSYFAAQLI